jgi:predicted HicB family RNase H-like nuclease
MNSTFEYKGYIGSAEVDSEDGVLVGRLLYIRDIIGYSASSVPELEREFRRAVDEYLEACQESGESPDTPCKGTFNVRVGPSLHRDAALAARKAGVSLNDFVSESLRLRLQAHPLRSEYRLVSTADFGFLHQKFVSVSSRSFEIEPANEGIYRASVSTRTRLASVSPFTEHCAGHG